MHQWTAEQTLEPSEALRLIQEQFPQLGAERICILGAGWDNTAFLIDEELIFRFPRRQFALPLLEAEWHLLPLLAGKLPLPIPLPEWRGEPAGSYPWPFLGYRMLPGFTACCANLTEEERYALAEPLAEFLKILHATPKELLSSCKILGDNMSRVNAEVLIPKLSKNLEEMKLLGLVEEVRLPEGAFRPPQPTTVVHGDFYVRHLLVDEDHRLSGVIDWGDMHVGDPAIDLSIAHSFLPKKAHALFRETYGGIDEETWRLAKVRSLYASSLMGLYAYRTEQPDLVRESLRTFT